MKTLAVGVRREAAAGERRVALVPDGVRRLTGAGFAVLVEDDAGEQACFGNSAYAAAGADIVTAEELYRQADVVLSVGPVDPDLLHRGQAVVGMLAPRLDPGYAARLAAAGVTALSLDEIPRTLARAQAMDALTSQANVAGYKAVLVAANAFERYFPMLVTAAGTARPAEVLVLGGGVAGLQAIGTARRLGAIVRGYDVRPAARGDIESLGAEFVEVPDVAGAEGDGGYARALTDDERQAQQAKLTEQVARHDVVITTARVPGGRPPQLVTDEAVKAMRPGSVLVDLAAGPLGGNVAGSQPGRTVVTDNGITVIGADNLPSTMATAASSAYSRNIVALLGDVVRDGELALDRDDEVLAGVLITHGGTVVHPATAALLNGVPS
jgi:proton-translocating NAD(P)+ transhydrogenase subunit alpha